jgi:hypothetical protein
MEAAHGYRVKPALRARIYRTPLSRPAASRRACTAGNISVCSLVRWRLPLYAVLRDRPTAANQLTPGAELTR